nr:MAG TPA: hypothetical protein [Caudoviricetes sp.]
MSCSHYDMIKMSKKKRQDGRLKQAFIVVALQ